MQESVLIPSSPFRKWAKDGRGTGRIRAAWFPGVCRKRSGERSLHQSLHSVRSGRPSANLTNESPSIAALWLFFQVSDTLSSFISRNIFRAVFSDQSEATVKRSFKFIGSGVIQHFITSPDKFLDGRFGWILGPFRWCNRRFFVNRIGLCLGLFVFLILLEHIFVCFISTRFWCDLRHLAPLNNEIKLGRLNGLTHCLIMDLPLSQLHPTAEAKSKRSNSNLPWIEAEMGQKVGGRNADKRLITAIAAKSRDRKINGPTSKWAGLRGNRPEFIKAFFENIANAENQTWPPGPMTVIRRTNGYFAIMGLPTRYSTRERLQGVDGFRFRSWDFSPSIPALKIVMKTPETISIWR